MPRKGLQQLLALVIFAVWVMVLSAACPAGAVYLARVVKDINPGAAWSEPTELVNINGTLFFTASDGVSGRELWKSDGTYSGTIMVKDITPGSGSSDIRGPKNVNGTLFFVLCKEVTGAEGSEYELWKSNGTEGGTVKIAGPFPGFFGPLGSSMFHFAHGPLLQNVNSTVYFFTQDFEGFGLWKSNGTPEGTIKVKNNLWVWQLGLNKDGILYFAATDTSSTGGLIFPTSFWRTDGTEAGTYEVKPLSTNAGSPGYLAIFNDSLFLSVLDPVSGYDLWKSDGTEEGTSLVQDFVGGQSGPDRLTAVGDTLFFSADDGVSGDELWAYHQNSVRPQPYHASLVKDILAGTYGSNPCYLTGVNGRLFFFAKYNAMEYCLYVSDGTEDGTVMLWGYPSSYYADPGHLTVVNDRLFFTAESESGGTELWWSDGTVNGTRPAVDINPGEASSWPGHLINVEGTLFFTAENGGYGRELWKLEEMNRPDPREWVEVNLFRHHFKKGGFGLKNAMMSIMEQVNQLMAQGDLRAAVQKLRNVRRRVDGYELGSRPDRNDWVIDRAAQDDVRNMIDGLIADLNRARR